MVQSEEKKLLLEKLKLENWVLKEKIIKDLGMPVLAILFGISVILNGGHVTLKMFDKNKFAPSVAIESTKEVDITLRKNGDGSGILPKKTPKLSISKIKIKKRFFKKSSIEQMASPKIISKGNYAGLVLSLLLLIAMFLVYKFKKKEKQKEKEVV